MRFEELAPPADASGSPTRFHRAMTVVGPLDQAARGQWIQHVMALLAGEPMPTGDGLEVPEGTTVALTVTDHQGRPVRIERTGGDLQVVDPTTGADLTGHYSKRGAAELLSHFDLDAAGADALQVVRPTDVAAAVPVTAPDPDLAPEALTEARTVLAHVEAEHDAALAAEQRLAELRARRDQLDDHLRRAHETKARRKYSAALVERERIQAELAALLGENPIDEESLEACVAVLDQLEEVAAQSERVAQRRTTFGHRRRLSAEGLEQALTLPTDVPENLPELHEQYLDARLRRAELMERLDDTAVSDLPAPTEPWVLTLARLNQLDLWERADRAIETRKRVAQLSVALGGAGKHRELVSEIESAHEQVDRAERTLYGIGRRPMMLALGGGVMAAAVALVEPVAAAPFVGAAFWAEVRVWLTRRRLAQAEKMEREVLERAGFTSWLGFKLRWVETLIDVNARETLQIAELEDQLASTAWLEVAGDIPPELALSKQEEIGRYADHLNTLRMSTDASDAVRRELLEEVEPRFESARRALLEVCEPFGVDPEHALSEVAALVFDARSARLQLELEVAEKDEERAVAEVVHLLGEAGEAPAADLSDIDERLAAVGLRYQQLLAVVEAVEAAASNARSEDEVRADLAHIDEVIGRFERAGITSTVSTTEDDREAPEIQAELEQVTAELESAERQVPDVVRISDRLEGLRRRIRMLETGTGEALAVPEPKELEMYLLGRVASARRVGSVGEPVPLIVDDVLRTLPRLQKHRLLDLLARLGESAQIVYLSFDEETLDWARHRSEAGTAGMVVMPFGAAVDTGPPVRVPASAPIPVVEERAGSVA
jgi:hypothetical protein